MAVADGVVPSPPQPPPPAFQNILASLARRRLGRAITEAITVVVVCVFFAGLWLIGAGAAFLVIGRRAYGEGSAMVAMATKVIQAAGLTTELACPLLLVLVITRIAFSCPIIVVEEDDQAHAPKSIATIVRELLHDTIVLAIIALMAFLLLMIVGELLKGSKSIKGSRREQIGSMISDVGSLCAEALYCLLILPILIAKIWKSWKMS